MFLRAKKLGEYLPQNVKDVAVTLAEKGFACFIVGGAYYEKEAGEKRRLLEPYIKAYRKQLKS